MGMILVDTEITDGLAVEYISEVLAGWAEFNEITTLKTFVVSTLNMVGRY